MIVSKTMFEVLIAVKEFPFQLEEIGWGQFEILIRIHFKAEYSVYPVEIAHMLKVILL